jgi:predicted transcriptional regulator
MTSWWPEQTRLARQRRERDLQVLEYIRETTAADYSVKVTDVVTHLNLPLDKVQSSLRRLANENLIIRLNDREPFFYQASKEVQA